MAIEIEIKIRLHEPEPLLARLAELDAVHDRQFLETNTYFDLPDGRLKTSDQGLRLRVEKDTTTDRVETVMTHKGPRAHGPLKSRSETEVGVSGVHAAGQMLSVLGYRPVLTFEKLRDRFLLDRCRVEIDRVPHLGTFVEIEGETEDEVLAVRAKLGLGDEPLIRASYIAMLATYLREHGDDRTIVRFDEDLAACGLGAPGPA